MMFIDCETVSLTGPAVLIQYAHDDGPIRLHHIWREPAAATLAVIEEYAASDVCFFNGTFDHYHLHRTHNVLSLLDPFEVPTAQGWADVEDQARRGPCLRPKSAFDLMLYAHKGPFQSLMERSPIRVRKVPAALAPLLASELKARVEFDEIFFARRKTGYSWDVEPCEYAPGFSDVVLRFGASSRLKRLAAHCLGTSTIEQPWPKDLFPVLDEWSIDPWPWVGYVEKNARYWADDPVAQKYAIQDVEITRGLYKHFGSPDGGDDDSELACAVASSRWRGFALDLEEIQGFLWEAQEDKRAAPRSPRWVLEGLHLRMDDIEALGVRKSDKATLERVILEFGPEHDAGAFALDVKKARTAEKMENLCSKLLKVGRAHPNFKVNGARSGRMSGTGKLSYHGIPKGPMRKAFPFADRDLPILDGGDFDGFEVAIFAAVANDPQLTADLESGQSIHQLRAASMYGVAYEDVTTEQRKRAKASLFAEIYGAQLPKIAQTLGLPQETVTARSAEFNARYPGVGRAQAEVTEKFCSMRQPNGIGTRIEWHEPADYMESLLGFRRYFTLENRVSKALFDLAQNPPDCLRNTAPLGYWKTPEDPDTWVEGHQAKEWVKTQRRKGRDQTAGGALQSALYGCAFQIQAANMRAAGNHRIQSTGAQITKRLQRRIWDLQPTGVHPWAVSTMQVHDEVLVCRRSDVDVASVVEDVKTEFRGVVPLIAMTWGTGLKNWGEV